MGNSLEPTSQGLFDSATYLETADELGDLMADDQQSNKEQFFYPTGRYYGKFTPEHVAFNANLQEFAQRVSLLCGLETGGKIAPEAAYKEIKELWGQLKQSKKELLDQSKPPRPELPEE